MANNRFDITNTSYNGKPIKQVVKPLVQEDSDEVKAEKEKVKVRKAARLAAQKAAELAAQKAVDAPTSQHYGRGNSLREAITGTSRINDAIDL